MPTPQKHPLYVIGSQKGGNFMQFQL